MTFRLCLSLALPGAILGAILVCEPAVACCPAPPSGRPVVNADQTVILIWDAATKTQHFIRKASFKSDADDFGFLVPSPSQPELNESGNEAFGVLYKLTEPETIIRKRPTPRSSGGWGCGTNSTRFSVGKSAPAPVPTVAVLEEKLVAGFKASVLEAKSTASLAGWLKDNGYAFSPAVEAWAKPYVEAGWKITALKMVKNTKEKDKKDVAASALRMSFKTDRPLFPYREPASETSAKQLNIQNRLLRIYFVADGRYQGELTKEQAWTGNVAWSGKVGEADRKKTLGLLKLPETAGPAEWWLTEFEDRWPYKVAPADVYFSRAPTQDTVKRPPIIHYVSAPLPPDVMTYAIAVAVVVPPVCRRVRRGRSATTGSAALPSTVASNR